MDADESDPVDTDTDDDGLSDDEEDVDLDGVRDEGETHPNQPDSDLDGQCDGLRADNENDGIDPASACIGMEGVLFVDAASTATSPSGFTWATAYPSIQAAVDVSEEGDEVWVATGSYGPASVRAPVITLSDGVDVYGGFAGTESTRDERTLAETVLDGTFGSVESEWSDPVVRGATAILDGFTITNGRSDDSSGGLRIDADIMTLSNLLFIANAADRCAAMQVTEGEVIGTNLEFEDNAADAYAGAVCVSNGDFTLTSGRFTGNMGEMGALQFQFEGTLTLDTVLFEENIGSHGAAVYVEGSHVEVDDCQFIDNVGDSYGALMLRYGGTLVMSDTLFMGNSLIAESAEGAALRASSGGTSAGSIVVSDSQFVDNESNAGGAVSIEYYGPETWDVFLESLTFDHNRTIGDGDRTGAGALQIVVTAEADDMYVEVTDALFRDNVGAGYGALAVFGSETHIRDTEFVGNRIQPIGDQAYGAGAYFAGAKPTSSLINVLFDGNAILGAPGTGYGGGLYVDDSIILGQATFRGNSASEGGAIYDLNGNTCQNCVVYGNSSQSYATTFSDSCVDGDDPHDRVPSGHLFLGSDACIDGGNDAWTTTYLFDFASMTTSLTGAVDVSPVDPGYHYLPTRPWVKTLEDDGADWTWTTHEVATCTLLDTYESDTDVLPADDAFLTCVGTDGTMVTGLSADAQNVFSTPGTTTFTVPPGIHWLEIHAWGGGGGGGQASSGAAGGYASGWVAVTPGDAMTVVVGGAGLAMPSDSQVNGGHGGGGASGTADSGHQGGSGGGLSGLFSGDAALAFDATGQGRALLIAGGGGGGCSYYDTQGTNTATGGGEEGGIGSSEGGGNAGWTTWVPERVGAPGTQSAGGVGCTEFCLGSNHDGSALQGGSGGQYGGSGGGGGYFGGGGGSAYFHGGGGSGYLHEDVVDGILLNGVERYAVALHHPAIAAHVGRGGSLGGGAGQTGLDGNAGTVVIVFR